MTMVSSSAHHHGAFRAKAAGTLAVFVGGPSLAYYLKVVRPRTRYQAHLAAMQAVPRPLRRTTLFTSGNEPMKDLSKAAGSVQTDLSRVTGGGWARYVPYHLHIVWRVAVLVWHAVPVLARYVAARYGLLGVTYRDAHVALKNVLAVLGPSFIKLGQWAATRPDAFPADMRDVLGELFDSAPPHAWSKTVAALERAGIRDRLASIEEKPLNSGSIAQVHRAVLSTDYTVRRSDVDEGTLAALYDRHDDADAAIAASASEELVICRAGTPVVVKVMHPGVREQILADSAVLSAIGDVMTWLVPGSEWMSLRQTAEEVAALAVSQLNLLREADNLIDFRFNFRSGLHDEIEGQVSFPKPLQGLSTANVLVETFELGESLNDANHKYYQSMGKVAMDVFMRMLFEHNLIHADLHPGNLLFRYVNPDGTLSTAKRRQFGSTPQLVVLDPGLVTSLSERERKNFISLFAAVASGDGELGAKLMYENAPPPRPHVTDMSTFTKEIAEVLDSVSPKHIGFSFSNVTFGDKLTRMMDVMRHHQVRIDMNFATLVSSVLIGEGMGRRLQPDFDIMSHALPFVVKCLKSHELEYLTAKLQETYLTTTAVA